MTFFRLHLSLLFDFHLKDGQIESGKRERKNGRLINARSATCWLVVVVSDSVYLHAEVPSQFGIQAKWRKHKNNLILFSFLNLFSFSDYLLFVRVCIAAWMIDTGWQRGSIMWLNDQWSTKKQQDNRWEKGTTVLCQYDSQRERYSANNVR